MIKEKDSYTTEEPEQEPRSYAEVLRQHTYPVCGKAICRLDWASYAYKRAVSRGNYSATLYYCSWTCLQKDRAKEQELHKKKLAEPIPPKSTKKKKKSKRRS